MKLLKELMVLSEEKTEKKFKITWVHGYGEHDGKSATHPFTWFTSDDCGLSDYEIEELDALEVGDHFNAGGPHDAVEIKRVSDRAGVTESTEVIKKKITEMAAAHEFSSGCMKSKDAKELVKAFKAGEKTFDLTDGRKFKAVKRVLSNRLEAGMTVLASYNKYNQGADIYQILGWSDTDKKYGEGAIKFKSIAEVFAAKKVKTLKALEDLDEGLPYGHSVYMVVKDLEDGTSGAWFYLHEGSWVRGSGAEKLSFTLVEEVK
jgi:hypothetical protein